MEGAITGCIAIAAAILLVSFPDSGKTYWGFLSERELDFVMARINYDRADAGQEEKFVFRTFMAHGLDVKVWGFAFIFCMLSILGFSFAFFLPIILQRGLGFSMAAAQCLVAPPYVTAGVCMYFQAVIGDKYRTRAPILLFNSLVALIGLPVMAFAPTNGAKYA